MYQSVLGQHNLNTSLDKSTLVSCPLSTSILGLAAFLCLCEGKQKQNKQKPQ